MKLEQLKQSLNGILENNLTIRERNALKCVLDLLERETVIASKLIVGNTNFSKFVNAHACLQSKTATNAHLINSYFNNMKNAKEKLANHNLPKLEFIRLKEEYFHNYKNYLEAIQEQKLMKASLKELRAQIKSFALLKHASEICSVVGNVKEGTYEL